MALMKRSPSLDRNTDTAAGAATALVAGGRAGPRRRGPLAPHPVRRTTVVAALLLAVWLTGGWPWADPPAPPQGGLGGSGGLAGLDDRGGHGGARSPGWSWRLPPAVAGAQSDLGMLRGGLLEYGQALADAIRAETEAARYDRAAALAERLDDLQLGVAALPAEIAAAESAWQAGRWQQAIDRVERALEGAPDDLDLLLRSAMWHRDTGDDDTAEERLRRFNAAARVLPADQRTAARLVTLGRGALMLGADAQRVLRVYFEPARQAEDAPIDAWLAIGELALDKYDYARAAQAYEDGIQRFGSRPPLLVGLARALMPSQRGAARERLESALMRAPLLPEARVLRARLSIDEEFYDAAAIDLETALGQVDDHPHARSLLAALAGLRGEHDEAEAERGRALDRHPADPRVDWWIGQVQARKYRFAEAAASQRRALELDPGFTPAKLELAQNLMRLGNEDEAWQWAQQAREEDPYSVVALNLTRLREVVDGFDEVVTEHFRVKMDPREMQVYGGRVIELLELGMEQLGDKYGLEIEQPVVVEFYPRQQDFAVRTFGVPGGAGILGACFGGVVTMNSPGGPGAGTSNWESTLWHELCHVVTLTVTRNRMPRWLSEGISVYEERRQDPGWGQRMAPHHRRAILQDDALVPLDGMSAAFLRPASGTDLMFAYFQASLVVEWLVEREGEQVLNLLMRDLAADLTIEHSLATRVGPIEELDAGFREWALQQAAAFGRGADWDNTDPFAPPDNPAAYLEVHPNHVPSLASRAAELAAGGDWQALRELGRHWQSLVPGDTSANGPMQALARAARGLEDVAGEIEVLDRWTRAQASHLPGAERLFELAGEQDDPELLLTAGRRILAIQPMRPEVHSAMAAAAGSLDQHDQAVRSWQAVAALEPAHPHAHFQLATLLRATDPERARRHVIDALAEAPRDRTAQALLLELRAATGADDEGRHHHDDADAADPDTDADTDGESGGAS